MATKAVIDTNVLLSGILFGGPPGELLQLAKEKQFQAVVSLYVLKEFRQVAESKFKPQPRLVEDLILEIASFCEVLPVVGAAGTWASDSKDNPVIETALKAKATYLITGDERLKQAKVSKLKILDTREFLQILTTS